MACWPTKVMKTLENQSTGRLRRRFGKKVLPNRDRKGVGAVGSSVTSVFNGVTMGLRPTKGDEDALWGRQFCLQPPFRRLLVKSAG